MLRKIFTFILIAFSSNYMLNASFMDLLGGGQDTGEVSQISRETPGEWMGKNPAEALTATDISGSAIFTKPIEFKKLWNLNIGNNLSIIISLIPYNGSKKKVKNPLKQSTPIDFEKINSVAAFDSWKGIMMYIFDVIAESNLEMVRPKPSIEDLALISVYSQLDPKTLAALPMEKINQYIDLKLKITKEVLSYEEKLFKKLMTGEFNHVSTFSYGAKAKGGENPHGILKIEIENKKSSKSSTDQESTETDHDRFTAYHKSEDGKSDGIRYSDMETFVEDLIKQFLHNFFHSIVQKKVIGEAHLQYMS